MFESEFKLLKISFNVEPDVFISSTMSMLLPFNFLNFSNILMKIIRFLPYNSHLPG